MQDSWQRIAFSPLLLFLDPRSELHLGLTRRSRTMNSFNNLPAESKHKLAQLMAAPRRFFYSHLFRDVFPWVGMAAIVLTGRIVVLRSKSEIYSAILSVLLTVIALLFFTLTILKERDLRRREVLKLLKSRHSDFFEGVRSDVASLIEKGRIDEGRLPGSS
jgi:hypothetical protein